MPETSNDAGFRDGVARPSGMMPPVSPGRIFAYVAILRHGAPARQVGTMKVLLKQNLIVLVTESADEARELAAWQAAHVDHVLHARTGTDDGGQSLALHSLGDRMNACREPLNVVSSSTDPIARLISNFADTPFDLDGRRYRSIEAFWQGLKFPLDSERERLAQVEAPRARSEGDKQGYPDRIVYGEKQIVPGTWEHWRLMEIACRAKFEQNAEARSALVATGHRPLTHIVRRDSKTIPGVIMSEIWMRIRQDLLQKHGARS
jgi:predicted NAD-dependent protein-ADP-ribosyltransferase YbiA (DUF1768 family)